MEEVEETRVKIEDLYDVAPKFTIVFNAMEIQTVKEYEYAIGKRTKKPEEADETFINLLKSDTLNPTTAKRLRAIYKNNGILNELLNIMTDVMVDWDNDGDDDDDDDDDKHYVAYHMADDDEEYIDIALDFEIIQHKERKKKGKPTRPTYVELSIGHLARFMSGQKWCLTNPDECHSMFANQFLKEVLKWGKREHGATVVTFHPVTQESVNMWKRLALRGELDEPFVNLVPQKGNPEFRQSALMDLFNLQFRICAVCDGLAGYTYDHPQLEGKYFFCGQRCSEVKWTLMQ